MLAERLRGHDDKTIVAAVQTLCVINRVTLEELLHLCGLGRTVLIRFRDKTRPAYRC